MDWAAGDLCIACGGPARREVRCAWCTEWIPAGRFCRACGCEVVEPGQYASARMLKNAGVDRFALVQRLREMDPEQAANLARIYNTQLAVVTRRVEELRFCEGYLLQKGFARRLEEDLVPRLPMEKGDLAALDTGPVGPLGTVAQALEAIGQRSPIALTRKLASIALLRKGHFEETFAVAWQALGSDDGELALEAALALAHWRVRLHRGAFWSSAYAWAGASGGVDPRRLAQVVCAVPARSPSQPWAAAALALASYDEYGVVPGHETGESALDPQLRDWMLEGLRAGLSSQDPDLRFTCAMALGEYEIVARALDSKDEGQRIVARRFLAKNNSPRVAPLLAEGPEAVRAEIMDDLRAPLPDALVEPVLLAVERGDAGLRAAGARLLAENLSERIVERLVRSAGRERDAELFRILLVSKSLPAASQVVRAVIQAGLLEPLRGALMDAPERVDFTHEAVRKLAAAGDAESSRTLLELAECQLDRLGWNDAGGGAAAVLCAARMAFGGSSEVRERAFRVLDDCRRKEWAWLSPPRMRELFWNAAGLIDAIVSRLGQVENAPVCIGLLQSRWVEVEEALAKDAGALKRLVEVLRPLAGWELYDAERCRRDAARLLAKLAVRFPGVALPAISEMLRANGREWEYRDLPGDLLEGYGTLARHLARDEALAAGLAGALAETLTQVGLEERFFPAIQLLTKLARDHPRLRKGIAETAAPILGDREGRDSDVRPLLDALAKAAGFQEES